MLRFIIILICTLIAISCGDVNKIKVDWNGYDPDNLKYAWITRDTNEVNRWISSLSDTTLSDAIFFSRVAYLSNITHFVYGNADPSEDSYWQIPKDERDRFKQDVRIIYSLYSKSCLFMKFVEWEQTLNTFNKYPQNGIAFTKNDISKIVEDLNRICDSLPNPSQSSLRPWINFIPCHTTK